ncbi:hypothetical protein [Nostoc sp.]|uniref:hypothetical protein n=1 Tax=Nostoc sp. TaxID=1180 RepID=UPI002FF5D325
MYNKLLVLLTERCPAKGFNGSGKPAFLTSFRRLMEQRGKTYCNFSPALLYKRSHSNEVPLRSSSH